MLHFATENAITGHPFAVMEWIEGRDLHDLAQTGSELASGAPSLGAALARIHSRVFPRYGFLGRICE